MHKEWFPPGKTQEGCFDSAVGYPQETSVADPLKLSLWKHLCGPLGSWAHVLIHSCAMTKNFVIANFKEHNRLSPLKEKHYTQGTFLRWTTIITTISLLLSVLCSLHSDLSCTFFFLQRNTINLLKAFHTHTLHSSTSATVSFSPNRFKQ